MIRRILVLVAVLTAPMAAQVQPPTQSVSTASVGGACNAGACASWMLTTVSPSMTLQVTGTFSGTLTFEATSDNITWFAVAMAKQGATSSPLSTTTTTTGQFSLSNLGFVGLRARATSWSSGGANVSLTRGSASAKAGGGGSGGCAPAGMLGDLLYDSGAGGCSGLADVATGQVLASGGVGAAPAYTATPTFAAGTLTANTPVGVTQTWNNAGVTFEGLSVNITNTASGGSSRLVVFKRAGVEQAYITPSGLLGAQSIDSSTEIHAGGDFQLAPGHQYLFSDGSDYGVGLKRDANTVLRATDGSTGVADFKFRHLLGGGSTPAVTNTSANSCGTTAATIAGTDTAFRITVGATGGTSCTVTFAQAFAVAPACMANNETTANLARATPTTSAVVIAGTFVAGDNVSGICLGLP